MAGKDLAAKLRGLGFSQVKSHMTALDEFEVIQVQGILEAHGICAESSKPADDDDGLGGLVVRKKKKKKADAASDPEPVAEEPAPQEEPAEPEAAEEPSPEEAAEPVAEEPVVDVAEQPEVEVEPEPAQETEVNEEAQGEPAPAGEAEATEQAEAEDAKDARRHFSKDRTSKAFALISLVGFLIYCFFVTLMGADVDAATTNLVIGYLGGLVSSAASSFYGSSSNVRK